MSFKNLHYLPQLFRSPFLRKVANGRHYKELAERLGVTALSHLLELRLSDLLENVYDVLLHNYRCEYIFKNALTAKCLSSRDGASGSYITDEFRVGRNRVDLAVFADTSTAYEIKTTLDSTTRLSSQADEYAKVFDLVYVVTTAGFRPRVERAVSEDIGIIELCDSGELRVVRESQSHAILTNLNVTFDCLRRSEMVAIATQVCKRPMTVPNSRTYIECKKRFKKLLPFEAHNHVVQQLKARRTSPSSRALLAEVPNCLKHAALHLRASNQEIELIREQLAKRPKKTENKPTTDNEHVFPIPQRKTERVNCA